MLTAGREMYAGQILQLLFAPARLFRG